MSNLLYKIKANKIKSHTIFGHTLSIYDDYMIFRRRRWFVIHEMTITYNHVAQANILKGVFFSRLEIINSGGYENASIKNVLNKYATKAKKVIDHKIQESHSGSRVSSQFRDKELYQYEKSINRLKELVSKGKISEKEFIRKRQRLLKEIK